MRKYKTLCLVATAAVAVLGSISSAAYAAQLSEHVEQIERSARADMVYLRGYIHQLENELSAAITNLAEAHNASANTDNQPESEGESESEAGDLPASGLTEEESESETEFSAESESDCESETEPPPLYVLAEQNGRIGVFDATGRLLCTLNVFVPSLPAADRSALLVGISVCSQEQLWEILDRYA